MTEDFQGRLFPKEAADAVGIAPATLRKYSQIVEEVTENDDFFARTEQGIRTYSAANITLLKRIAIDSKEEGLSVKEFTKKLFEEDEQLFESTEAVASDTEDESSLSPSVDNTQVISPSVRELLSIIDQQNKKIDQLLQMMNQFTTEVRSELTEVKPMLEKSQQLLEHNDQQMSEMKEDIAETKAAQQEQKEAQNKALGDSPFNTEATIAEQSTTAENSESTSEPEKVGFFQRLFGRH